MGSRYVDHVARGSLIQEELLQQHVHFSEGCATPS
jgi:hypothetical protein